MDAAQYQNTRQPLNDVVNPAVDNADASNALPPEVLSQLTSQLTSQITASVLQQLKATNLETQAPTPVPTDGVTSFASVQSDTSLPLFQRIVHTPPSPQRPSNDAVFASPTSPTKSTCSVQGRHSPNDEKRSMTPPSQANQPDEVRSDRPERPNAMVRKPTEITTLEKIWGPLFDGSGPTARLGQFLRGLALHLIEDYEPKYSLVITPSKMQRYYEDTKLTPELYPWQAVFDDRTSSISRLYREIEAQHHLVQESMDERPDIPGLTPLGFEKWSTLMLLAHPEQEFERLQKAVLDMPICNYDDRKERFPKEISRRLFPNLPDQNIREKLEKAMVTHCNISLLSRWSSAPEQGSQQPQQITAAQRADSMASNTSSQPSAPLYPRTEAGPPVAPPGSTVERDRQPYSTAPSEGAIDEEDDMPTPQPIERERKPYAAQPGGGRNYDDINRPPTPPESRNAAPLPGAAAASAAKLGRSASVAGGSNRPSDSQRTQPIPINPSQYLRQPAPSGVEGHSTSESLPPPRQRANSILNQHHPSGRAIRHRSPSANTKGADRRRPDGDGSFGPSSYGPYSSSPSADILEEARRQREFERRYQPDRHEPSRSSMYELPARDREARPRYPSNAGYGDTSRSHYTSDEDYYRATSGRPQSGYDGQQYYR